MHKVTIVALAAIAVALPIIALQRSENTKLKAEAASLRASLASPSMIPRNPAPGGSKKNSAAPQSEENAQARAGKNLPANLPDILALPDPMHRIRALLAYVDSLAPADIPAALVELRKGSPEWDPDAKMLAHMLLTRWAQENPEAAFASLDTMNFKQKGADPHIILASLAAMNPKRAGDWLDNPDNELVHLPWMGHILAGTIAKEWVRQDLEAALAWAETVPEKQRLGAYTGVLGTLATTDPKRASTLATDLEPGGARNHIIGEIAKTWARNAPDAALAWAQSLEKDERKRAMSQALGVWAQTKPTDAVSYLEEMAPDEPVDPFLPRIAGNWAAQAPDEAAKWVATQPEGEGKNEAMGSVMWNWTTRDPEAAGTWLAAQPSSRSRDQGITGLAKAAFDFDPESALSWATQIDNDDMRNASIDIGMREWKKRDPNAAREWAGQNGIGRDDGEDEDAK